MKNHLIIIGLLTLSLGLASCTRSKPTESQSSQPQPSLPPMIGIQGEKAIPTIEGNLIKVNNRLCAVSRGPMDEKGLGLFKGQVAYEGNDSRYKGKTFEFNYCCAMCQNMFPKQFQKDPDSILRFHGL